MLSCSVCLGLTELASFSIATFCLSSNRPLAFRGGSDDLGIPYERSTPTLTLSVSRGTYLGRYVFLDNRYGEPWIVYTIQTYQSHT
jgi:hypothetical protein